MGVFNTFYGHMWIERDRERKCVCVCVCYALSIRFSIKVKIFWKQDKKLKKNLNFKNFSNFNNSIVSKNLLRDLNLYKFEDKSLPFKIVR